MTTDGEPLLFAGAVQQYAWGKRGADSLVGRLVATAPDDAPYAELWFGVHPNGPARVIGGERQGLSMQELIARDPEGMLGKRVAQGFSNSLPFLFKVLSVEQPLSIQAHPDLSLAGALHRANPRNYPDANHKPEMALALTEMSFLFGFRAQADLLDECRVSPELIDVIGDSKYQALQSASDQSYPEVLHQIHREILSGDGVVREKALLRIRNRLAGQHVSSPRDKLMQKLLAIYGTADTGILTSCLMNLCQLKPGEAIFIPPNIPHAYLSGDLIECMANSDNVVRAGLTSKFQDADTLLAMLKYRPLGIEPLATSVTGSGVVVQSYALEVREFALSVIRGVGSIARDRGEGPVLIFCLEGGGDVRAGGKVVDLAPGTAALVPYSASPYFLTLGEGTRLFEVRVP